MVVSPSTALSLLDRLREGDAESWKRMNELYAPLMRSWLQPHHIQPADIHDLTQNAFAVVLRRLPDFQHNGRPGAFRTWLRDHPSGPWTTRAENQLRAAVAAELGAR